MNCWDLSVKFYSSVLGVSLEGIYSGDTPSRSETRDLIYSNVGKFSKVTDPFFGDIILLKLYGIESHIAVYLGGGKMLHTSKLTGSVVERVEKWEHLIVGYFRIKGQDHD